MTITEAFKKANLVENECDYIIGKGAIQIRKHTQTVAVKQAWENFYSNEHVKRAIEVALAGGHSITGIGHPNSGEGLLKIIHPFMKFIKPCLCGHLGNPRSQCTCTMYLISKYRDTEQIKKALDADILISVVPFEVKDMKSIYKPEPFSKVKERIEKMNKDETKFQLTQAASDLLFIGMDKLNIPHKKDKILAVAETIARLDNLTGIQSRHIAEALQYTKA